MSCTGDIFFSSLGLFALFGLLGFFLLLFNRNGVGGAVGGDEDVKLVVLLAVEHDAAHLPLAQQIDEALHRERPLQRLRRLHRGALRLAHLQGAHFFPIQLKTQNKRREGGVA
jgi:hypothetical protein